MEHAKHTKITPDVRDAILRLNDAGLKISEIESILNVSRSSISYTLQCYKAAECEDWDTLQKLSDKQALVVKWALDKFGKTMPGSAEIEQGNTQDQTEPTMAYARMDERFDEIQKALNGIGFLLSEILDELRG